MEESMSLMETLGWLGIIAIGFVVAGIIATITTPKLTTNDISVMN